MGFRETAFKIKNTQDLKTILILFVTHGTLPCGFNSRIRTTSTLGADRVVSAHLGSEPTVVGKTASVG